MTQNTTSSNKGMKLTKPELIGALQLIPGVRPTMGSSMRPGATHEYA